MIWFRFSSGGSIPKKRRTILILTSEPLILIVGWSSGRWMQIKLLRPSTKIFGEKLKNLIFNKQEGASGRNHCGRKGDKVGYITKRNQLSPSIIHNRIVVKSSGSGLFWKDRNRLRTASEFYGLGLLFLIGWTILLTMAQHCISADDNPGNILPFELKKISNWKSHQSRPIRY